MAHKSDIQYIYYVDGSAARKAAPILPQGVLRKPIQFLKEKKIVLHIDLLAHSGIIVAAVMLVLMTVGWFRLQATQNEIVQMQAYVDELKAENHQLRLDYENAYDLEVVERTALAMGMVSVEEVEHVNIQVQPPAENETASAWEKMTAFLTGLFA